MENLDIPDNAVVVLKPHGFIAIKGFCASDLDVVNAARVSFAKQSEWESTFDEKTGDIEFFLSRSDEGVLRYLLRGKHGTPFEHTFFKFHIRAPIFVFREWHRHRIGISINEESGRYTELAGNFYLPEGEAWRHQVGRPGRYRFEKIDDLELISQYSDCIQDAYDHCYETYLRLMREGVAKEIARTVLPVGTYSQMIWSCNARSLMNFISLRNAPDAQYEIRQYAVAMEEIFAKIMPITYDAYIRNNRIAP